MNYRGYTETKMIASSATTISSPVTLSLRIPQNRRRLEMIMLDLTITGTATTGHTDDAYWSIVRAVRLKVNDILGQRNLIQASGTQLIMWHWNNTGKISRFNAQARRNSAAVTARLQIPIWIRHPGIEEPIGNLLSLPMWMLNEDPTLEIDLEANATYVGTTPPTSVATVRAVLCYRDVDPAVKYLPSELVNSDWTLPGTGKQSFELANSGFVSSLQLDGYSTAFSARSALFTAADHEYQLELGPTKLRGYFPDTLQGMNDSVSGWVGQDNAQAIDGGVYSLAATNAWAGPGKSSWYLDFLFDDLNTGSFSPASLLNANTVQLGGDKIKLMGTNFSAAGSIRVLSHKFLTRSVEELKGLILG